MTVMADLFSKFRTPKNVVRYMSKNSRFSQFFLGFPKSTLNFEHFQKKDDPHSLFISEITHSKKRG